MNKNFMKIIMNPTRLRIVQFLLIHKKGTTGEIREELDDIPSASLYRHMKVLLEAGCIQIIEEKQRRGSIERTYQLTENPLGEPSEDDIAMMFQTGLMSLMMTFQKYFQKEDVNPQKDMLSLSTSTLMLTDAEFMQMLQKISTVISEVITNQPKEGRKQRRITFVSSPCEE